MKIQPKMIGGAEPLMCSVNVQRAIDAHGGKIVYGWIIRAMYGWIEIHNHHCVWEDSEGNLWDVTPHIEVGGKCGYREIEFARDDDAVMGKGRSLPQQYIPLRKGRAERACRYMANADKWFYADTEDTDELGSATWRKLSDLARAKSEYWTCRANHELRDTPFWFRFPENRDYTDVSQYHKLYNVKNIS